MCLKYLKPFVKKKNTSTFKAKYIFVEGLLSKASFHSGKLSMDWNGQENFSLSCELWVGTNDSNTKKNVLVHSNPQIIFLSGN